MHDTRVSYLARMSVMSNLIHVRSKYDINLNYANYYINNRGYKPSVMKFTRTTVTLKFYYPDKIKNLQCA